MTRAEIACPRCGQPVSPAQDWCLQCGAPARTRLVRAPDWRKPVAALAALAALSLAALAVAFVQLTDDPAKPQFVPVPITTPSTTATTATTTDQR